MKFTDVKKIRTLEMGVPVLTQDVDGKIWLGKLVSEQRDHTGTVYTFEKAMFPGDEPNKTDLFEITDGVVTKILCKNIVGVRVINKPKKETDGK